MAGGGIPGRNSRDQRLGDLHEAHVDVLSELLAMETEEVLRSQPIDGVVFMGGCDKTTPGLIMGAISQICPPFFCRPGRC